MADAETPEPVETPLAEATEEASIAATPSPAESEAEPEAAAESEAETVEPAEPVKPKAADEAADIIKTVVYALLIAFVLRVFLFQPFTIPSGSMIPNLAIGDYIIVSKYSYGYSKHSIPFSPSLFKGRILERMPKRGDIVVFKDTKDDRTDYVKRLMGLPGDRIQVLEGKVYVNGKMLPQKALDRTEEDRAEGALRSVETLPEGKTHTLQDTSTNGPWDTTDVYLVPENHYFMMGDNRDNSADSRVPKAEGGVEFIPAENLVGKAQIILFSWREGVSLFKPWTWFTKARPSRALHLLR